MSKRKLMVIASTVMLVFLANSTFMPVFASQAPQTSQTSQTHKQKRAQRKEHREERRAEHKNHPPKQ